MPIRVEDKIVSLTTEELPKPSGLLLGDLFYNLTTETLEDQGLRLGDSGFFLTTKPPEGPPGVATFESFTNLTVSTSVFERIPAVPSASGSSELTSNTTLSPPANSNPEDWYTFTSEVFKTSGKWYFEVMVNNVGQNFEDTLQIGVSVPSQGGFAEIDSGVAVNNVGLITDETSTTYNPNFFLFNGDSVGIKLDMDEGSVVFVNLQTGIESSPQTYSELVGAVSISIRDGSSAVVVPQILVLPEGFMELSVIEGEIILPEGEEGFISDTPSFNNTSSGDIQASEPSEPNPPVNSVVRSAPIPQYTAIYLPEIYTKTVGKYYWEVYVDSTGSTGFANAILGVQPLPIPDPNLEINGILISESGRLVNEGNLTQLNETQFSNGSVIGFMLDMDNKTLQLTLDGFPYGSIEAYDNTHAMPFVAIRNEAAVAFIIAEGNFQTPLPEDYNPLNFIPALNIGNVGLFSPLQLM